MGLRSGGGTLNAPTTIQRLKVHALGHRDSLMVTTTVDTAHTNLPVLHDLLERLQTRNPHLTMNGLLQAVVVYGVQSVERESKRKGRLEKFLQSRR